MIPAHAGASIIFLAFPRTRGDDPSIDREARALEDFSPHPRG